MSKTEEGFLRQRYKQGKCNNYIYQRQAITLSEIDIPIIKAVDFFPSGMIPFNEAMSSLNKGTPLKGTVHMFLGDRNLESVWTYAEKYAEMLKNYEAVLSPDFSVYANWDNAVNLYNLYRNRFIGAYFQQQGLTVIPTVTWSTEKTYDFAFLGLEPEGTYAISANGCFSSDNHYRETSLGVYREGMKEFVKRLNPKRIILHGSKDIPEADYGDAQVLFYRSKMSVDKNWRQYYSKKSTQNTRDKKWSNSIKIKHIKED